MPLGHNFSGVGECTAWFCSHFSRGFIESFGNLYSTCYSPAKVFERPDVRLVLDVGGANGAFARHLHSRFGDRIVVVTGNSITPFDSQGAPFQQVRAEVEGNACVLAGGPAGPGDTLCRRLSLHGL